MRSTKKAFTLVELMVAMAIIAALMGMSVFGINLVQRSSRNTQRRSAMSNIDLAVRNYQINNGTYPTTAELDFQSDGAYIGTEKVVEFEGSTAPQGSTDSSGTQYCYESDGSTFSVGIELEGGSTEFLKSDNNVANCTLN